MGQGLLSVCWVILYASKAQKNMALEDIWHEGWALQGMLIISALRGRNKRMRSSSLAWDTVENLKQKKITEKGKEMKKER